jgi:A/G-specific adenine glycosylase
MSSIGSKQQPVVWDAKVIREARRRATAWFDSNGRDLPWRRTQDPYRVWVSEIMLQQTQVATVLPYYERFLDRFPSVTTLAAAPIDDVLFHWAGLGYYRRARQMHLAAQVVANEHDGIFPTEFEAIRALPGIGRYTAGAIASFALDLPFPIVEANTQRLFARLMHMTQPTASAVGQEMLWNFAESMLSKQGSGRINQSLMEIGSQLCLPREPKCASCPLQNMCPTFRSGKFEQVPAPKPQKTYTDLVEAALVISDAAGRVLMRRCEPSERWAGLWDFPRFDVSNAKDDLQMQVSLQEQFMNRYSKSIDIGQQLHTLRHAVTRYRIVLKCFEASLRSELLVREGSASQAVVTEPALIWADAKELQSLALNSSAKKLRLWLEANL